MQALLEVSTLDSNQLRYLQLCEMRRCHNYFSFFGYRAIGHLFYGNVDDRNGIQSFY